MKGCATTAEAQLLPELADKLGAKASLEMVANTWPHPSTASLVLAVIPPLPFHPPAGVGLGPMAPSPPESRLAGLG